MASADELVNDAAMTPSVLAALPGGMDEYAITDSDVELFRGPLWAAITYMRIESSRMRRRLVRVGNPAVPPLPPAAPRPEMFGGRPPSPSVLPPPTRECPPNVLVNEATQLARPVPPIV